MDRMSKLLYDTKRLMMLRYPTFGSQLASANILYKKDLKYPTAATDGKNIYFDPEYLKKQSESDRLFLIAHELMHIKFAHAFRLEDRNGIKRDLNVWNDATDAIINANLARDGFTIKEGYINRPDALQYSAEEFYNILLKEKEEQRKQQEQQKKQLDNDNQGNQNGDNSNDQQSNNNSQQQNGQQDNNQQQGGNASNSSSDNQHMGDDHSLWNDAFEKRKQGKDIDTENNSSQNGDIDEQEDFAYNRKERLAIAREAIEKMKRDFLANADSLEKMNLGEVGESAEEFDWKMLLRREIEKTETIWSQRRSIAENNYAYRLEEYDIDDDAETEVMIDVSGSVDLHLVRAFLRILKPIIKHSKLKVGCFNEKYWGMTEIKKISDIDNFEIPQEARGHSAWTEDWDLAVRSFTPKREINKIVFTDGIPGPGNFPKEDLKHENVIWLVYGNKDFRPCCGTVIQITERQLESINACLENAVVKVLVR